MQAVRNPQHACSKVAKRKIEIIDSKVEGHAYALSR